jgi:superfamily I DNA/RNA helicase
VKNNEILMLTFSRFTRDDFLNKIKKYGVKSIDDKCVKTIDSFAKSLIDENNEIDVSLLSYKFMQYLENTTAANIKKNTKLSSILTLFVDEAQDLNETQYNIIRLLKEKIGIFINLIGDPNQNIYQFRNSSDKYLTNFQATTFYLTKNFRSYDPIIEFSKYLRPNDEMDVEGKLGKIKCKPVIVFHENDSDLESHIISFLDNAKKCGINYKDVAILAPTRGRMKGYGNSHGLCLISNLLYKNRIKFKQFYEEATDEINNNIRYCPEENTVNVLTYMGSKGLEWRFVLLIDANICLINKRHFSDEKHENDRYLLYVACSRAIENVIIFSKYRCHDGNMNFQLNPWFSKIPKSSYILDKQYEKYFKFPQIKPHDMRENEKRVIKVIDKFDEKTLDELAQLCQYGSSNQFGSNQQPQSSRLITKIYDNDFAPSVSSNMFLGKYIENVFFALYRMKNKMEKRKYVDIENIIKSKHIVMDIPTVVSEWYYINRDHLSWELFDSQKSGMDTIITECVEKKIQ